MTTRTDLVTPLNETPKTLTLPPQDSEYEIHVLGAINAVLRQRRLVATTILAAVLVTATTLLLSTRTYSTTASFILQGRRNANLQGLAAQFGLLSPSTESGQSPNFYLDLLRTREILGVLIDSTSPSRFDLAALWRVRESDPARRRERLIGKLRQRMSANVAQRTGVLTFTIKTTSPELSSDLANRILTELNRFNLEVRQSQASAERKFAEKRRDEVRSELRTAEDNLLAFTARNRNITNAPSLQVEQERLQREVALRQQIFGTLAEAAEQAKIDEVRDTPVISVVERPMPAPIPDPRGLVTYSILAAMLGALFGSLIALARDHSSGIVDRRLDEFRSLRRATLEDLLRPWRLFTPRRAP